jgi:hypothetical protein
MSSLESLAGVPTLSVFSALILELCQDQKLNYLWFFLNISALKSLAELSSSPTFFALKYPKIPHNLI